MINRRSMPPSSSGLGYLVLSQGTGVRVPVGVLEIDPSARRSPELAASQDRRNATTLDRNEGFSCDISGWLVLGDLAAIAFAP